MNKKYIQKQLYGENKKNGTIPHSDKTGLMKKNILGVNITNASKESVLEFIISSIKNLQKPYYIVTPNPEMIVLSQRNLTFKNVLNNAKLALNDGVGIGIAARILGNPLNGRFTGVELVDKLCEGVNDWPITVGFLGAGQEIAELTAECLKKKYPRLKIVFAQEEWSQDSRPEYLAIDILFIAFGFPKQEFWMESHLGKIPVKVMVGVGGAFDYISGKVPRAPTFIRDAGFEWLFRLFVQPWRWKRQMSLLVFIGMVIKEKIRGRELPLT